MALKVNPMELADLDAVLGLQDHIILIDTADLTVHTKKDITVAGGIVLFIILAVCLLFFMLTHYLFTLPKKINFTKKILEYFP